jgi:hypothetical protein
MRIVIMAQAESSSLVSNYVVGRGRGITVVIVIVVIVVGHVLPS